MSGFNQVQESLWWEKLCNLERQAELAKVIHSLHRQERLVDLQIYRAQFRNVLSQSLYYLEVQADGQTLYKIGVTRRQLKERMAEVNRDLRCHFQNVAVRAVGSWQYRGNVELYFKHRYKRFNYPIGSLTEYYRFKSADAARVVLDDLEKMPPKVLSSMEMALFNKSNRFMQQQPSQG